MLTKWYFLVKMIMFLYCFQCKEARNSKNDQIFTISVEMRELQAFHLCPKKIHAKTFFGCFEKV